MRPAPDAPMSPARISFVFRFADVRPRHRARRGQTPKQKHWSSCRVGHYDAADDADDDEDADAAADADADDGADDDVYACQSTSQMTDTHTNKQQNTHNTTRVAVSRRYQPCHAGVSVASRRRSHPHRLHYLTPCNVSPLPGINSAIAASGRAGSAWPLHATHRPQTHRDVPSHTHKHTHARTVLRFTM